MANNSDSSHATSSGSDSDHPRTPPLAAAHSRTNPGRSLNAPSKIPKLRTASVGQVQAPVSPPRTPADRDTAPAALDWGSGGEWSALVGEIKSSSSEVESEAVEDDGESRVEVRKNADDLPQQSAVASSELLDDFEHSTAEHKRSFESVRSKEVSDNDDEPLIVFEDVDQRGDEHGEEEGDELQGGVVLETESSGAASSQTSDTELSIIHATSALKQSGFTESSEEVSDEDELPVVAVMKESKQHTIGQDGPHGMAEQETELSDADISHTSDSDVSEMELSTAAIDGSSLSINEEHHTTERGAVVSPEMVLRGLVRDAHPDMVHFTLPHSLFSPNDLQKGLQYAYIALQVATSKLAMLELLNDETTNMTGSDLRRWIALVDNSTARTCTEPRISVVFESLSVGEKKAALEELVQSRLVVKGEVEQTRALLRRRILAKELQERNAVTPVKRTAEFDKEGGSRSKKRRVSKEDSETAFDAFLTLIMVVLVGALYRCVRD